MLCCPLLTPRQPFADQFSVAVAVLVHRYMLFGVECSGSSVCRER